MLKIIENNTQQPQAQENPELITVPRYRYDELLEIETRVDVLLDLAVRNKYLDISEIFIILGDTYRLNKYLEARNKDKELDNA